jgi:hypothetical protein
MTVEFDERLPRMPLSTHKLLGAFKNAGKGGPILQGPIDDESAWFSGFIDGEGNFSIQSHKRGDYCPRFRIALRIDDEKTLLELCNFYGGYLGKSPSRDMYSSTTGKKYACKPQITWEVSKKSDLEKLVKYLDTFPLRTKKARDYAIWREAVLIYTDCGGRDSRLKALSEDIKKVREFVIA